MRRLSTQGQTFTITALKVWFPQKPPVRFRERATIVLMTGVGWKTDE
jgi:hypothetical protein